MEESSSYVFGGVKRSGILAVNGILIIIATLAVGSRIFSRHKERLSLEKGDYLIILALVCSTFKAACRSFVCLLKTRPLTVTSSLWDGPCVYALPTVSLPIAIYLTGLLTPSSR